MTYIPPTVRPLFAELQAENARLTEERDEAVGALELERAGNREARELLDHAADFLSDEPDPADGGSFQVAEVYDRIRRYLTDDDPRAAPGAAR